MLIPRRFNIISSEFLVKPNLFILGAGKCGTTTVYNLLGQFDDIHVSPVKEPSHFCSYFQVVRDRSDYWQLFDSRKRYRVDASHVYLSNPETAPVLRELFPDAKFIVTLRDPKKRAYSLFRHMRRHNHEDGKPLEPIECFEDALLAEEDRYASGSFFHTCRHYFWNFMYCRSSLYDEQLSRYYTLFNREDFHVFTLSELARDPLGTARNISCFLGLGQRLPPEIKVEAANRANPYAPCSAASDMIMDRAFEGLTARTDRLVGRALDWEM
jgi:hypothetical protein